MTGIHQALAAGAPLSNEFGYIEAIEETASNVTFTYSSRSLGAENANRQIIVAVAGELNSGGFSVSTLTVGGVSATQLLNFAPTARGSAIWTSSVPSGATGDIVITFPFSTARFAIATYRAVNYNTTTSATATDSTGNPSSVNINVLAKGICIAANYIQNASTSETWSGLTENYDSDVEALDHVSFASDSFASAQTPLAVSCTDANSETTHALSVVAIGSAL